MIDLAVAAFVLEKSRGWVAQNDDTDPEWRSSTLYHWYLVGTWRKEERRDSPGDGVQSLRHDQVVKVLKLAAVSQVSTAQQLRWYWASNTTPQH
jgi:hypothetical protein